MECSTHSHGNILDLIFTNKDDLFDNVIVQSHKAHYISSDHNIVSFDLSLPNHLPIYVVPHYVFDYGNCDYEGLNNYILNSDIYRCLLYSDVEVVWSIIKNILILAISIYIPKFRLKPHQYPAWFTSSLRHRLNYLHSLRKKCKRSPTVNNLNHLTSAEQDFQHQVNGAKTFYCPEL